MNLIFPLSKKVLRLPGSAPMLTLPPACNKIWPGYQEAEITRGKLKTTSSYYVFDSIRNDLVTMRFHQGDILFEVHVSIADIFEEVVMIIPYSRKVECPHHDSADQHGCRVCMGAGVHVVSNLKMRFVLPRGVINNEVFVARGQGDYSPRAGKYGDINIIVKTLNVRGFIRGPVDRFTGSSSDLYVAREINERVDTVELTGIFNSEKVVFKYQDTAEDIKANELYNPKFSKIYSDLKSKYKLTDSDFFTLEALNYQCLPNLGLPFRKIPALRGRLCLPRIDSRDLYNSKGLLNSLHQLAEKRFQAYIDVLKTLDSKSKSGAAREHLTYKSSSPIEPIAVSPDRGSPYSHYADDDL